MAFSSSEFVIGKCPSASFSCMLIVVLGYWTGMNNASVTLGNHW
jgi:hypothetical protein